MGRTARIAAAEHVLRMRARGQPCACDRCTAPNAGQLRAGDSINFEKVVPEQFQARAIWERNARRGRRILVTAAGVLLLAALAVARCVLP
jgi:hypothetical protein